MNQRRGLERLTRRLRGHLCHSQFAEFIVNQWQKFLPRLWIPLLDAIEDLRHVAHETERYQKRTGCTSFKQWGPATGVRDERVTTLGRNQRGIGFTDAWLYPIGYTSRIPSRRDWTTIAQRFSVGSRARISQVPKGRLKFIPISARKTCRSFSRPFGTHAMRNCPPNVETSKMHARCRNPVIFAENCTFSSVATYKTELFTLGRFRQPQRLDILS